MATTTSRPPGVLKLSDALVKYTFTTTGALSTATGALRQYNDTGSTLTIAAVRASVGTAPTGSTIIVDVNKDGTTLYTTQANRPAIAISGNTVAGTVPDVTTIASGSYLTVDVDQIGSGTAGSNLVVEVFCYAAYNG